MIITLRLPCTGIRVEKNGTFALDSILVHDYVHVENFIPQLEWGPYFIMEMHGPIFRWMNFYQNLCISFQFFIFVVIQILRIYFHCNLSASLQIRSHIFNFFLIFNTRIKRAAFLSTRRSVSPMNLVISNFYLIYLFCGQFHGQCLQVSI